MRSTLVFTRTKHRAKSLAQQLEAAGLAATSIQGNLSQNKWQKALDGFRSGRFRVLVATDIAARGIDVAGVSHVINFDVPDTPEAYTHRTGRTGRACLTGEAFTFAGPEDQGIIRHIEQLLGKSMARRHVQALDAATGPCPLPPISGPWAGRTARKPANAGQKRRTPFHRGSERTAEGRHASRGPAGRRGF